MNQNVTYSRPGGRCETAPALNMPACGAERSTRRGRGITASIFAFFNLDDKPVTLRATWKQLGLDGKKHAAQNVWTEVDGKESKEIG